MEVALLEVENLSKSFGGLTALSDLTMEVGKGEIVGLIGPNGAGKTTLFNCITGFTRASAGRVRLRNTRGVVTLTGLSPEQVVEVGVVRTFQSSRVFATLTVLHNVRLGRHCRMRPGFLRAALRDRAFQAQEKDVTARARTLLEFVGLSTHQNDVAGALDHGNRRRVEIARALATEPTLLLLDEPMAGMNPQESKAIMELIQKIRGQGVTVLLIEHQMRVVMGISDRVVVLDYGRKIAQGPPEEVQRDPRVIEAYLGDVVVDAEAE